MSNQATGQTSQVFGLKIQIYYTNFSSIFYRSCQIQCFLHTVAAILRFSIHVSRIFASNHNSNIWKSCDSEQKALELTNPANDRRFDFFVQHLVINVRMLCRDCADTVQMLCYPLQHLVIKEVQMLLGRFWDPVLSSTASCHK